MSCTAERQGVEGSSTVFVKLSLIASCDTDCVYDDQAVMYCQVGDQEPEEMNLIPEDESLVDGSYSNETLWTCARFEATPGDAVRFWVEDSKSGATYEGLDGIADELAAITTEAIDSAPSVASAANENVCYVTPDGYAFHNRRGCPRLSRSNEVYEMTISEAQDLGYEPCDSCC